MLKNIFFISFCLFCATLQADEMEQPQGMHQQNSRYQLSTIVDQYNQTKLYLLDTLSGKVWTSSNTRGYYTPWALAIDFPIEERCGH